MLKRVRTFGAEMKGEWMAKTMSARAWITSVIF